MKSERRKKIRQRRKARNKNKLVVWFRGLSKKKKALLITGVVILCLLIAAIIYVASIFGKLNTEEIKEEDIVVNELPETVGVGYTNFVLFGGDSRTGEVTKNLNTDSIIIVSLNNETKEVKMVSVYRDTLLDMTNGKIKKCNSAYSSGGATQAINMLNMNLDLDIKKYVTVDFGAVADLIDMLGGIEVDVSTAEYKAVNKYIDETGQVAGKKAKHLTHGGVQTLDGVQATTYARIRKGVGDDYARTERQRLIIQKVAEKAMKSDLSTINKIIDKIFPQIATNLSMTEILSYATDILRYKIGENTGFPFVKGSGTIPGRGSCVFPMTLKSNVAQLHEFLYGTENYQPSAKVGQISAEIASIVGNRKADPVEIPGQTGGDGTTPSQGGTTTPGEGGTTTPGEGGTTTPGEGGTTTPGDDGTTTPGEGGTTTPGEGGTTTPGEGGTTTPGEGGTTTPGEGGTTTPGEGGTTTPGEGGTTTPGEGGTTTPSGGGITTPGEGETTTPSNGEQ